ncbi:MAG: sulfotransferase [Actinomycetota bacterium]|nr:sulfotransferase [Actinomycetota bacterium]
MKILYVLGRGRSGSSIFANVIGEHEGFFSAGELRYLWDPVVRRDGDCGCGATVSTCPVWSQVLDRLSDVSVEAAGEWQREVVTERNLLRLVRYPQDGTWPALDGFVGVMSRVYQALSDVTGVSVIVDSSKRPAYAAVLRLVAGPDLYCIHLIRDPRASAFSWGNSRHRSVFGGGTEVRQRNALDSTVRWNVLNLEAEFLLRRLAKTNAMRLRYEEFVAAPRDVAARVTAFARETDATSPFVDGKTLVLTPNHSIAGNPSRFAVGEVTIEDKGRWQTEQSALDRRVATTVASPFLHRYGYKMRPSPPV